AAQRADDFNKTARLRLRPANASSALGVFRRVANDPDQTFRPRTPSIVECSAGIDLVQHAEGNAMTTVSVFGGTGFLGRRLVQRLTADGMTVRVAVRHADRARSALRAADLDRVMVFGADVRDQAAVATAVAGADAVVDAVSAYVETAGVTF